MNDHYLPPSIICFSLFSNLENKTNKELMNLIITAKQLRSLNKEWYQEIAKYLDDLYIKFHKLDGCFYELVNVKYKISLSCIQCCLNIKKWVTLIHRYNNDLDILEFCNYKDIIIPNSGFGKHTIVTMKYLCHFYVHIVREKVVKHCCKDKTDKSYMIFLYVLVRFFNIYYKYFLNVKELDLKELYTFIQNKSMEVSLKDVNKKFKGDLVYELCVIKNTSSRNPLLFS